MNFGEFVEKSKTKLDSIIKEIEVEYETFWQDILEDLNRKKIGLEQTIEKQETTILENKKEIGELSETTIKLNDGIKQIQNNLVKYEARQKEMLDKILTIEQRENKVAEREKVLKDKEDALSIKEGALDTETKLLDERQRNLKRYLNK